MRARQSITDKTVTEGRRHSHKYSQRQTFLLSRHPSSPPTPLDDTPGVFSLTNLCRPYGRPRAEAASQNIERQSKKVHLLRPLPSLQVTSRAPQTRIAAIQVLSSASLSDASRDIDNQLIPFLAQTRQGPPACVCWRQSRSLVWSPGSPVPALGVHHT